MKSPGPRIIFVNRVYAPSTEATAQLLTDLTLGLAARGWNVHVIAGGDGQSTLERVTIHRAGAGDKKNGLLSRCLNYWHFVRNARRILAGLVQADDRVVVMTDPPLLNLAVASPCQKRGARIIPWIQDIYPEILATHLGRWSRALLWPLAKARNRSWRASNHCVTLGSDMAGLLISHGVEQSKVTIIPNWAPRELEQAPLPAAIASLRVQFKWEGKFIVAYSGNLGRVHEFDTVMAAARLLQPHLDIRVVFIGRGARLPAVQKMARALELTNVDFYPPVPREQLAVMLGAADAHFVTLNPDYRNLVYPSKLVGVLAAGRPVLFIGPAEGELSQLIACSGSGCRVSPGEGRRLADCILQIKTDGQTRAKIGREARILSRKEFSLASALAKWEAVLSA